MAAPTIVATAPVNIPTATSGSIAVPAGTVAGDWLLIYVMAPVNYAITLTGGAGGAWTVVNTVGSSGTSGSTLYVAYRQAASADLGASITVTFSNSSPQAWVGLSSVHNTSGTPTFVAAAGSGGSSTLATAPVASNPEPTSLVLAIGSLGAANTSGTLNQTALANVGNGAGNGGTLFAEYATQAATGNTTPGTATYTNAGTSWVVTMVWRSVAPTGQVGWRGNVSTAGTSGTYTLTVPAHFQAGDIMVLASINEDSTPPATPSGWTLVAAPAGTSGGYPSMHIWAKVCASADIGSTVTLSEATYDSTYPPRLVLDAFYNAGAPGTSLTSLVTAAANGGATAASAPAITTTSNGSALVAYWATLYNSVGTPALASPATGILQAAINGNTNTYLSNESYSYQPTAGTAAAVPLGNSAGSTARWTAARLALSPAPAPAAPTLTAPANASYSDLAGTPTFAWTPNPNIGDGPQNGYQFRRKVAGGPSYLYWNAGTSAFQSTAVTNSITSPSSVTFPSGAWADGTIYNWSVASQESGQSLLSPFASDFTVNGQAPPTTTITAPAGTVGTTTPTVTGTIAVPTGTSPTGYRVVIYTAAQVAAGGFSPGGAPNVYDSGTVASSTMAFSQPIPAGVLSNSTAYVTYAQGTETGGQTGGWASQPFSVSYGAPAIPTVTVTPASDPASGAPGAGLTITGHSNLLTAVDASYETGVGSAAARQNATVATSTAYAADGSQSLQVTSTVPGVADYGYQVGPYAATPGQSYVITSRVRAASGTGSKQATLFKDDGAFLEYDRLPTSTAYDVVPSSVVTAAGTPIYVGTFLLVATNAVVGESHFVDQVGIFPGDTLGYQLQVLNDGPSFYLPLTDAPGTVALNAVGSGNGTANSGVTFGTAGPVVSDPSQTAATLNGVNGQIVGAASTPMNLTTGAVTVEAWVYVAALPSAGTGASIVSGATYANFGLALNPTGNVYAWLQGSAAGFTGTVLSVGTWHHLAAVYAGGGSPSRTVYVDGVAAYTDTSGTAADESSALYIGGVTYGYSTFLNGAVAHVAVYPKALTAARIRAHYTAALNTAGQIVQKWTRGGFAAGQTVDIQRSVDQQTWLPVRNSPFPLNAQQTYSGIDYEAPTNIPVYYRARTNANG